MNLLETYVKNKKSIKIDKYETTFTINPNSTHTVSIPLRKTYENIIGCIGSVKGTGADLVFTNSFIDTTENTIYIGGHNFYGSQLNVKIEVLIFYT